MCVSNKEQRLFERFELKGVSINARWVGEVNVLLYLQAIVDKLTKVAK